MRLADSQQSVRCPDLREKHALGLRKEHKHTLWQKKLSQRENIYGRKGIAAYHMAEKYRLTRF